MLGAPLLEAPGLEAETPYPFPTLGGLPKAPGTTPACPCQGGSVVAPLALPQPCATPAEARSSRPVPCPWAAQPSAAGVRPPGAMLLCSPFLTSCLSFQCSLRERRDKASTQLAQTCPIFRKNRRTAGNVKDEALSPQHRGQEADIHTRGCRSIFGLHTGCGVLWPAAQRRAVQS